MNKRVGNLACRKPSSFKCRLLFKRPIRLPENLSLQIKQYLLVFRRSGEIGNGVRAFG